MSSGYTWEMGSRCLWILPSLHWYYHRCSQSHCIFKQNSVLQTWTGPQGSRSNCAPHHWALSWTNLCRKVFGSMEGDKEVFAALVWLLSAGATHWGGFLINLVHSTSTAQFSHRYNASLANVTTVYVNIDIAPVDTFSLQDPTHPREIS